MVFLTFKCFLMWNLLSSTGFGVDVSLLQEQERTMNSMSEKDTGEALCTGNPMRL